MQKTAVSIAAALCALAAATTAQADTVAFSGYAHGSQAVTFTVPAQFGLGSASNTVGAGGFLTTLNGGPSFTSYCIDLYQTIGMPSSYTDYSVAAPGAHAFANSNAYADLSRLFATAGTIGDALHEAAFQVAVWEIAYETGATYNLASGFAYFTASADVLNLASSFLSNLGTGSGRPIGILESRGQQDVIYAPVPEPSEIALMLAGLVAIAGVARRRRNASAA